MPGVRTAWAQASRTAAAASARARERRTPAIVAKVCGWAQGRHSAMRQGWITRRGGPEVLEVREGPDPQPKPGEVRIRVRAAGVNFSDLMARMGVYPDAPPL